MAIHIKKLGASRSYRESNGEFLCDGSKLLYDAVNCGAEITTVLSASSVPFPLPPETRLVYASKDLINSVSPLLNAQDIVFVCKKPSFTCFEYNSGTYILLDYMQDPGNVGSVIRSANALGISGVILTGSCADPYNPKTIRASMGAIFRQKIVCMGIAGLKELKENGIRFIGAALDEGCRDVRDVNLKGSIIAIGSEGRGLSAEVLDLCDEKVTIPIIPECESLNAAVSAAIIMWESVRRQSAIHNVG